MPINQTKLTLEKNKVQGNEPYADQADMRGNKCREIQQQKERWKEKDTDWLITSRGQYKCI